MSHAQAAPLPSLTREEAEQRARLVEVVAHDVALDWRGLLEGPVSRSTSTITFTCREPGASTFVDAAGHVLTATLNGRPVVPVEPGRIPLVDLAAENTLVVEMVQDRTSTSEGILRTVDPTDGLVYVWTSFEPDDARRVFACFDQPDLKAPFAFTVTVPSSWVVTSNGGPAEVTEARDGARTWTFPATPPLSTYVTVVNAGPFHEVRERRGGHDLGLFSRQSTRRFLERDADHLLTLTEQGLAFYAERFDQPFPQERYDQVFVPNMGGAMENWGCITYGDSFLWTSTPTPGQRERAASVLLHEMAHMWFGDLVTMRWWDDIWLNEAFASFASTWASASATEFTDAWASFHAAWKQWGYDEDASPATHPIRGEVPSVASAMANFDGITYAKGQAVLAQLLHLVGEDTFSTGLAAYFRDHAWGNTVLTDLTDAIGTAAGRDLAGWTAGWLDAAGTDVITLDGGAVVVEGPDGDSPRTHRLDVGSYAVHEGKLEPVATTPVETTGTRTPVHLPEADLHLPNDNDLTFAAVRLDPHSLTTLVQHAHELPTSVGRALAGGTLRRLVLDGQVPAETALDGLLGLVGSATGSIEPLMNTCVNLARSYTPADRIAAAEARVAAAVRPLADHPRHGAEARHALARTASTDEDFAALADAVVDDVELGWLVEARKARLGRYDEAAAAALQERDPDPEAWVSALGVRTAQPTDEAKAAAWEQLYERRTVPADKMGVVVRSFWFTEQEELLRPWCDRYLAALPGLSGGGMLNVFGLAGGMFPTVGDEEFLAATEAMAEDPQTHPVIRSGLLVGADRLRRMLRARG